MHAAVDKKQTVARAARPPPPLPPENEGRKAHEPMLLWLVNSWAVVEPLLTARASKLNPKVELLLLDCRTIRPMHVSELDPRKVFDEARVVETTAVRATLSSHPFLFNDQWAARFGKEIKKMFKEHGGTKGVMFLFALGDSVEHSIDEGELPMPDFVMRVAPYFRHDLDLIAEASLKALAQQHEREREQARRRAEITMRVAAAKAAQEQAAQETAAQEKAAEDTPSTAAGAAPPY